MPKLDIVLILDSVRSAYNVGAILRTADATGIKQVIFVGLTPHPIVPGDQRPKFEIARTTAQLHKTALGAETTIESRYCADLSPVLNELRNIGYTIAALEQSERSVDLFGWQSDQPVALIVGHERTGVQSLDQVDIILEIPMRGTKESLNVSVAAGIALYHLLG